MSHTPMEIRTVELQKTWVGGYQRQKVDELLDEIADSLAAVIRERDELSERLQALEAEATSQRELESLLRSTLVSAEQAAQEAKAQARRESDLIVQEAHAESRRVIRETAAEKRHLEEEMMGIRGRLRAALEVLSESGAAPPTKENEIEPATIGEALETGIREVAG